MVLRSRSMREPDLLKYAYEDLGGAQFERLVVFVCRKLLGAGVQGFAAGPDGGRDARFAGTAELYPSRNSPWRGTTIAQAKHTNGINRSFSETDFYSRDSENTVIGHEIPRIQRLRASGELDNYILFSNRRLSATAEAEIRRGLSERCEIPPGSIAFCGLEQLESWLKEYPEIAVHAELSLVDSPLIVSPDELADIVEAFARQRDTVFDVEDDPPVPRVRFDVKNRINGMTLGYAREQRKRYLRETAQISRFLAAPENESILGLYETVVDEFQLKIFARRRDFPDFDRVLEYLTDLLFSRDPVLRRNKRLTRTMLFYMYWNCDIGETEDAETN